MTSVSLSCSICSGTIENPVTCTYCGNSFCKDCAERSKKKKNECPFCKNPFDFTFNEGINHLLKAQGKKCDICNDIFDINELEKHRINCKKYKCNYCAKIYNGKKNFLNHLLESVHKDIIVFKFSKSTMDEDFPDDLYSKLCGLLNYNKNIDELEKKLLESEKKEPEKKGKIYIDSTEIHPFLNLIKKASEPGFQNNEINTDDKISSIRKKIEIPNGCYLNTFMDLYYCNSQTTFKIKYNICYPGSYLCLRCLKLNQIYHNLKRYYLINKAGRVSRCKKGKFHCYCLFKKKTNVKDNTFVRDYICSSDDLCDSCLELNDIEILKIYFPNEEFLYKILNN